MISLQLSHKGSAASATVIPAFVGTLNVVLLAAASMHPSMVELTKPSDEPVGVMSPGAWPSCSPPSPLPGAIL